MVRSALTPLIGEPSLTIQLMSGGSSARRASKREQRHERELSEQFERAYRRLVEDWRQKPNEKGAGATSGTRIFKAV
jgi:hypothetical protein